MNKPKFEISVPNPNRRIGWYLSALFFILMISSQLTDSIHPRKHVKTFVEQEFRVEKAVMLETLSGLLPRNTEEKKQVLNSLNSTVSQLIDDKNTNPHAARLYITIRYEKGKKILPQDLEILQKSNDETDQVFAKIYSNDHLSHQEAQELASKLSNKPFSNVLAKIHAYEKAGDFQARKTLLPLVDWNTQLFLIGGYVLLLVIGIFLWIIYFYRRNEGKLKPQNHPAPCHTNLDTDRNMLRFGLYFMLFFLIQGLVPPLLGNFLTADATQLISKMILFLCLLVIIHAEMLGQRNSIKKIIGKIKNPRQLLFWGIGGAIANLPVLLIATILGAMLFFFLPPPSHPITEKILQPQSGFTLINVFLLASVFAPVIEEITFRGLLLPALTKRLSSRTKGILLSSFLFAAIHPQGAILWPALTAVGAMSALLTYQTRSLIPSILMHSLHNTMVLIITLTLL